MDKEEHIKQMKWESFKDRVLNNTTTVYNLLEFKPIQELCEQWISQRDETKYKKTTEQLLEGWMEVRWIPMGWVDKFSCGFVNKFDLMENNDKTKLWVSCVKDYLKNQNKDEDE